MFFFFYYSEKRKRYCSSDFFYYKIELKNRGMKVYKRINSSLRRRKSLLSTPTLIMDFVGLECIIPVSQMTCQDN